MSTFELILLRHGESEWNAKNLFTGWVDVALSLKGENEAKVGNFLKKEVYFPIYSTLRSFAERYTLRSLH